MCLYYIIGLLIKKKKLVFLSVVLGLIRSFILNGKTHVKVAFFKQPTNCSIKMQKKATLMCVLTIKKIIVCGQVPEYIYSSSNDGCSLWISMWYLYFYGWNSRTWKEKFPIYPSIKICWQKSKMINIFFFFVSYIYYIYCIHFMYYVYLLYLLYLSHLFVHRRHLRVWLHETAPRSWLHHRWNGAEDYLF